MVTLKDVILVFDYLHDPSHSLKRELEHCDKPVIFFISHSLVNNNHFNPGTFEIAQNHKRIYVVSNSLPAKYIPSTLDVAGMSRGDRIDSLPGNISVYAYGAENHDVSFVVSTLEGTIFHAGNLNIWDMPDETGKQAYEKNLENFTSIVNRIAEDFPELDAVMMNVDPRISLDYAQGARELCQKIKVKDFFPMDIDGDSKEACDFMSYLPKTTQGHCLKDPGESVTLAYKIPDTVQTKA